MSVRLGLFSSYEWTTTPSHCELRKSMLLPYRRQIMQSPSACRSRSDHTSL